jgi:hypothetical protein
VHVNSEQKLITLCKSNGIISSFNQENFQQAQDGSFFACQFLVNDIGTGGEVMMLFYQLPVLHDATIFQEE